MARVTPETFKHDLEKRGATAQIRHKSDHTVVHAANADADTEAVAVFADGRFQYATIVLRDTSRKVTSMKAVIAGLRLTPDRPWRLQSRNGGDPRDFADRDGAYTRALAEMREYGPVTVSLWHSGHAAYLAYQELEPLASAAPQGPVHSAAAVGDALAADLGVSLLDEDASDGDEGLRVADAGHVVHVRVHAHGYVGGLRWLRRAIDALATRGYPVRVTAYMEPDTASGAQITTLAVGASARPADAPTYDAGLIKAMILRKPSPEFGVTGRATVALERGETAWNPVSTKPGRALRGPATCTYTLLRDGGIQVHHTPAPAVPAPGPGAGESVVDAVMQAVEGRRA